jgi:phospholipid/cholesterol/gamma-HCH transport system ATP-binding protein
MGKEKPVIEVINVDKSFGDNHVLRDFSMSVSQGENLVILGKSGSGKSVLIKCIINLLQPRPG